MNLAVNTVGTTEINAHGDNVNLSISVESSCQWSENPAPLGAGSSKNNLKIFYWFNIIVL